jgi:hypothetical protein
VRVSVAAEVVKGSVLAGVGAEGMKGRRIVLIPLRGRACRRGRGAGPWTKLMHWVGDVCDTMGWGVGRKEVEVNE